METTTEQNLRGNTQVREMADESMFRNLAAQAEALWPQEEFLFQREPIGAEAKVLDIGCGTGEISARLARLFPKAHLLGADIEEPHLERARQKCEEFGSRVAFATDDALALRQAPNQFDPVVSRHVLQTVPDARRVV